MGDNGFQQPAFCAIKVKDKSGRVVLLRSCFHGREFYPLSWWVCLSYYCPVKASVSFDFDIRQLPDLDGEGECPVCRVAVWIEHHSLEGLMSAVAPSSVRLGM